MFFNCPLLAFFEEIPCFARFLEIMMIFRMFSQPIFAKTKFFGEKASTKIMESTLASKPICALISHLSPILVFFRPIILLHITT